MNCKPQQMAMVVRTPVMLVGEYVLRFDCLLGKTFRVIELLDDISWTIEPRIWLNREEVAPGIRAIGEVWAIADEYLMPIEGMPVDENVTDEVTA
jgi:hypothetical protein